MQITLDATYLSARLLCSHEDKLHCMKTVKQLLTLSQLVCKEGLLIMDDLVCAVDDPFLSTAMRAATTNTTQLESTLYAYLIAGNYDGKSFLQNLLVVCGIPALCNGILPKELSAQLQGWFGVDFLPTYHSEIKHFYAQTVAHQMREQSFVLEFDALCSLSQSSFEAVCDAITLAEKVDLYDLALALKGAGEAVSRRFMQNFTGYGQAVLEAQAQFMEYPRKTDVETSQRKIINAVQGILQEVEKNAKTQHL